MHHPAGTAARITSPHFKGALTRRLRLRSVAAAAVWSIGLAHPGLAEKPEATTRSPQALSLRTKAEVENIANLIDALRRYAKRSDGRYPARIDELVQKSILTADELRKLTTSPLGSSGVAGDGYQYYLQGKNTESAPGEVLIMGRNPLAPSDPRRAVGLQDGSVTWWKSAQVAAFLKAVGKTK